ncbi:putative plastid-lipid-associated protein 11 [Dorcoceras hygrometricum]|uniref:Putative plastid-lipid-associated protein 11 n=1 Tax=Dorcoceras hygrometricum TaxID=472368 RepID=A0A2Z7CJQ1_9LAMI|nr:putative plastid-lipid-associated protein 11 [Dorcoceras hygrometricum]
MASLSPPTITYTLQTQKPSCYRYRTTSTAVTRSSLTDHSKPPTLSAKSHLLRLISDQDRGLRTQSDPQKLDEIIGAIDSLAAIGRGTVTTDDSLSATWRMLWTTEKEQLFILKNAGIFGTAAGDVLQVIDTAGRSLNNVITFPPDGVFFVRSNIQIASHQRVNFHTFSKSALFCKNLVIHPHYLSNQRFESCYMDDEIRVVKDIRQDYLVVERAPYSWKE